MLSKQELEDIAMLAKLEISNESFAQLLSDMKSVVEFANRIGSVKLEKEEFFGFDNLKNKFRADEVVESISQHEILKNSKAVEEGFFKLSLNSGSGG